MNNETTAVIVAETGSEASLTIALHANVRFVSSARRAASVGTPHKITWFTGNSKCKSISGKALPDIAGWAIECPDLDECGLPEDFELVDAMGVLVEQGQAAEVIVQHQDDAGKPRYVRYWALSIASLFVVCEGMPSKSEMYKDTACRWGVAWVPMEGQRRSSVQFVGFIKELMDAGYEYPFHFYLSSYCTDRILAAMYAHVRVLDYADRLREQANEDEPPVAYYAYALPTVVSTRTITAGKEIGKTSEVYYPIPAIPRTLNVEYLEAVAISADQAAILEENDRIASTVTWSIEKSGKFINGDEVQSNGDIVPVTDLNTPF